MEYAIIDIETTGLDLKNSSIIEVGAIIIEDNLIKDTFSSFVFFDGVIPETVKKINKITEEMLREAPSFSTILPKLKKFIGEKPVVAHNGLSFDFPILENNGLEIKNKHDSLEFAFFVLPINNNGHSIEAIAAKFNLGDAPHRALEDCKIEFQIINKLKEEYSKKSSKNKELLKYLAFLFDWWWKDFLPGNKKRFNKVSDFIDNYKPYRKEASSQDVLEFESQQIDIDEVDRFFTLRTSYSEDRPEQRKMARMVACAFNEKKHLAIEAGTGTGKSKAYLAPSLIFALKNSIPIIISTHTKALQDQLLIKEIPHLKEVIDRNFKVVVLKGKKNYICLDKFDEFTEEIIENFRQKSLYIYKQNGIKFSKSLSHLLLTSWILDTERGDWDELPYWFKDRIPNTIEQQICNFDELCGKDTCKLYEEEKCFLAKARLRARDADIVIVNHAVTLSGIVLEEPNSINNQDNCKKTYSHTVFPNEAKFLIFDEAHHLEDDATSAWEHIISKDSLSFMVDQLYGSRGILSNLMSVVQNNERLGILFNRFDKEEVNIKSSIKNIFTVILPHIIPLREDGFSNYLTIDDITTGSLRDDFLASLENLKLCFLDIERIIYKFIEAIDSQSIIRRLSLKIKNIDRCIESISIILNNDDQYVRYIERNDKIIAINATPISVAKQLKEYVYDNFNSVIFTSATLTINKNFNFFKERCGTSLIEEGKIDFCLLDSSFDYKKQVKFYLPKGISYGSGKLEHFNKSADFLKKAIIASSGGSLVLCSSHEQVKKIYDFLSQDLSKNNIWLLRQGNSSVNSIIRDFKKDTNSTLIGTLSLWEGIDVPGNSLRSLFIYKIPYSPPNNPIITARRIKIKKNGGNDFNDYYEPLAALTLKQGFGRLIRKSTDIGIAVLLEESLIDKPRLMNSLPEGVVPERKEIDYICKELSKLALLSSEE